MVSAGLTYQYYFDEENSIISLDEISPALHFIVEGSVDMYYKHHDCPLVTLENGSYFGDISCIFRIKNQYSFIPKLQKANNEDLVSNQKFYSIDEDYLGLIFKQFPGFMDLMKIRALRRQRYYRKLKN